MGALGHFKSSYRSLITFCLMAIFLSGFLLFSGRRIVMGKVANRFASGLNQAFHSPDAQLHMQLIRPSSKELYNVVNASAAAAVTSMMSTTAMTTVAVRTTTSRKKAEASLKPIQKILPKVTPGETAAKKFRLTLSSLKLHALDPEFKNPCWYIDSNRKILRCFPYFFLAGFPKCGTTDLYHRMVAHPLIVPGKTKEPHYLTRSYYKYFGGRCEGKYHCGSTFYSNTYYKTSAYLIAMTTDTKNISPFFNISKRNPQSNLKVEFMDLFPDESLAVWKEGQKLTKYPGITVDASASTAWDYKFYTAIAENDGLGIPRNTTADWVRRMFPGTRILMSVRNPVDRAFSDYMMLYKSRGNSSHFHRLALASVAPLKECLESGKAPLLCTTFKHPLRLKIGLYYLHIKNWFEKLSPDQILVVRFEDYTANPAKTLARIFRFLDLPALSQEALQMISEAGAKNVSPFKYKQEGMLPETRELLGNFFKSYNKKLAKLLKDDIFLWNDSKPRV